MSAEIQAAAVVPEAWAIRAASYIWMEQSKLLDELGHPSRGGQYTEKTVHSIARLIQYAHDAALPKDRN